MKKLWNSSVILLLGILFNSFQVFGQTDTNPQIYSKYDFIPGEKVIFFDDFSI